MAQKPETIFKARVRRDLKKLPMCWFAKIQQVTINGTPDFLMCVNGVFVALELKATFNDKTTALQDFNLQKIGDCGGFGIVTHPENWKTVYKFLYVLATEGHEKAKKYMH